MLLAIPTADAHAYEEVLSPWEIDLGDELVFHITPTEYQELGYLPTGLYRNGELVYLHEHGAYIRGRLFFSDDGLSLLVVPREWRGRDSTFIRFYHKGVREKLHPVKYLLADRGDALDPYICFVGPSWVEDGTTQYDRERNFLQFTTVGGYRVTFDLTTGLITSQSRVFPLGPLQLLLVVLAVIALATIVVLVFVRKRTSLTNK